MEKHKDHPVLLSKNLGVEVHSDVQGIPCMKKIKGSKRQYANKKILLYDLLLILWKIFY